MFYVLDDNNNKVEAFDKEGVLAVLAQAIADGSLANIAADSAFITKLKCCVGGGTFKMAFITQAKYNELVANNELTTNTYYFITDDTTYNEMLKEFKDLTKKVTEAVLRVDNLTYIFKMEIQEYEIAANSPIITLSDKRITKNKFIEIFPLDEWTNYYLMRNFLWVDGSLENGELIIALKNPAESISYPLNILLKCTEANIDSNVEVKGFLHRAIYEYNY